MNVRRVAVGALPPILFGVTVLLVWQAVVKGFGIKPYVLAAPSDIWSQLTQFPGQIASAAGHTGLNALIGLLVGVIVGVVAAAVCTRLTVLAHVVSPLVGALAAVPIVCTSPLLLYMYGLTSSTPRRAVVAIAAFVPVFINTMRGLRDISSVHEELMHSLAASRTAVLRVIRLPGALPHFCTGLRIAASVAVISAVVSEYFGGLQNGLGYRISYQAHSTNYPGAWAAVFAAVVLGLTFFVLALLLERALIGRRVATAS
jgi:NitT/TauT family transport system permease protein